MDQGINKAYNKHSMRNPSQVTEDDWIGVYRQTPDYPHAGDGKWKVYALSPTIDNLWRVVMLAPEEGYLGSYSKVSTASLLYTAETGVHVICIYTYDRQDREDVMRIRAALRELGIEKKISYAILDKYEEIELYHE